MMNKEIMHKKANELFWWFEQNRFVNLGAYPRNTNLVFAFADYIETLSDNDISEILSSTENTKEFRDILNKGIDIWLELNSKTMTIL